MGGTACLWALGDVCGRYGMSVGFRGRYSLSVGGTDCLWAVQPVYMQHDLYVGGTELRSCVKVEVAVLVFRP